MHLLLMANLASLWQSTNFLSQSIGVIVLSIHHRGWETVKLHFFCEYKAKLSQKEEKKKKVSYQGKSAVTMGDKGSAGRG